MSEVTNGSVLLRWHITVYDWKLKGNVDFRGKMALVALKKNKSHDQRMKRVFFFA